MGIVTKHVTVEKWDFVKLTFTHQVNTKLKYVSEGAWDFFQDLTAPILKSL